MERGSNEREEKKDNDRSNILPVYSAARSEQDMSAMVSVLSQVIGNYSSSSSSVDSSLDVNPLTLIPQSVPLLQNHSQSSIQDQAATSSNNHLLTPSNFLSYVHQYSDNNVTDLNFDASRSFNQYSSSGSFDISQSSCNTSFELPASNEEQQQVNTYYQQDEDEFGNSSSSCGPHESNWEKFEHGKL
ncbi:hypothetical protein K7X08_024200 [Anisodus acutangulus]|uniref:Uncharacterized protein n=1 Tax=Anisodus acutangulus TaxID=402998 RepID=A0A9Q1REZ6_9SOLA|nr:hypothetical protein K7X08_024200 [Anisodus acutangulus]